MKNNWMFILGLILYFNLQLSISNAQIIDNKINMYAEAISCTFHGKKVIHEGNFSFPSLYRNLTNSNGYSFKVLYNHFRNISWGIESTLLNASNWEYNNKSEFKDSKTKIISFSPVISFHTKFSKVNLFNRGKVYVEVMPTFGYTRLTLSNDYFKIYSPEGKILSHYISKDSFFGYKGKIGIEWSFTQYLGTTISYSYQQNFIKSTFYCDTHFSYSQLSIGIILKLFKDKYFLYR